MHTIQDKQFRLNETGQVLFQRDPTNPLPGEPVAKLVKGESLFAPKIVIDDIEIPVALTDRDTAQKHLDQWILSHMNTVIGPLVALGTADAPEIDTPVAQISRRLHEALGILPRAEIEGAIEALDADMRRELRARRVRLGPVLISMPDLTKPAAVRLRALLWALWHDKELPVAIPPDGMVSVIVDPEQIDPVFYRSIGYPVYAQRAIRVDMLDRVISAIYDSADKGLFKAKHEMAEWLGCPIAELYDILTAMGHTKVSDPADVPKTETPAIEAAEADISEAENAAAEEKPVETPAEPPAPEQNAEAPAPDVASGTPLEVPAAEDSGPTEVPVPVPQVKPELATFRLRRGRAHEAPRAHKPREKSEFRRDRKKGEHRKDEHNNKGDRKPRRAHKKPRDGKSYDDRSDRVVASAAAQKNADDSPFAILNQLKVGRKE